MGLFFTLLNAALQQFYQCFYFSVWSKFCTNLNNRKFLEKSARPKTRKKNGGKAEIDAKQQKLKPLNPVANDANVADNHQH